MANNVDFRGVRRGRCSDKSCDCSEYNSPPTQDGPAVCRYCGHYAPAHENLGAKPSAASAPFPTTATTTTTATTAAPTLTPCPNCGQMMPPADFEGHSMFCKPTPSTTTTAAAPPAAPSTPAPPPPAGLQQLQEPAGWPPGTLDLLCSNLPPTFPRRKVADAMTRYPSKGDLDGLLALLLAAADGAESSCAAAAAPRELSWPADAVQTLSASLPDGFPRAKVEELLRTYPSKGDMDGLLALLLATADMQNAPRAADPDPETLKLIEEVRTPVKECILCLDELPVTKMYTVNCPASHRFCAECMTRYVALCIKDNLPAICPAPKTEKCTHVLGEDELNQIATAFPESGITKDQISKYSEQQLMRAVKSIPGIIGCPTPQCGNWVIPADTSKKECCVCQACGARFCSLCKKLYHFHCSCDEVAVFSERWMQWCVSQRIKYNHDKAEALGKLQLQQVAQDKRNTELMQKYNDMMADERYKQENGRLCPKCNRVIIKDGGCDSMVCGRDYHGGNVQDGCGTGFQWSTAKKYRSAALNRPKLDETHVDIPEIAREIVHVGVVCDICKREIKGLRFSCLCCPSYDLCERCEAEGTLAHPQDHLWRIVTELRD